MNMRTWRVYGEDGHRQRESFAPSWSKKTISGAKRQLVGQKSALKMLTQRELMRIALYASLPQQRSSARLSCWDSSAMEFLKTPERARSRSCETPLTLRSHSRKCLNHSLHLKRCMK